MKRSLHKFYIFAVLIIACIIFCIWQNNSITISESDYINSKIPDEFNDFIIAHISDLHNKQFGKNQEYILTKLEDIVPNAIVITGDLVDRRKYDLDKAMDRIFEVADKGGALWVIDADIRDYFGSINHDKLLLLVKQRITDRRVLKLIKGWLKAGVLENGQYSESTLGAPQGGVISPLLSNIYLNYFDICWNKRFGHLGELVRYADDFVILCKRKAQAEEALKAVKGIMDKLELTLHGEKTRLVDMYFGKDSFDFLGFNNRFQRFRSKSWKWYWTLQQENLFFVININ
jgi:hypothetical protein